MPRPQRNAPVAQGGGGAVAVALELGDDLPWPGLVRAPAAPPAPGGTGAGWEDGGRLDSREQRRAVRERFAAHPPARLLVVVDGRQTPDRGSLGLIADLADHAQSIRVWPAGVVPVGAGELLGRVAQWREGLGGLGVGEEAMFASAAAAQAWLAGGDPER